MRSRGSSTPTRGGVASRKANTTHSVACGSSRRAAPVGATVPERPVPAPILLGGWPGYSFPDLNAVATWLTATPMTEQTIEAGYHDTDDLRLVRSGIAIVHRPDLAPSRRT